MIYILANGRSERFGSNKLVAEVWGEPLIARTCRLIQEFTDEPLVVLTDLDDVKAVVDCEVRPGYSGVVEAFVDLFSKTFDKVGRILFGDVLWSEPALKLLLSIVGYFKFGKWFQCQRVSEEFYATVWVPRLHREYFLTTYERFARDWKTRPRTKGGAAYDDNSVLNRYLMGTEPWEVTVNRDNPRYMRAILLDELFDDWTIDLDLPIDYDFFKREYEC